MLHDPAVKSTKAHSVAWAWVYFLMKSDAGKNRAHLKTFHEALRAGKSGREAGEAAFPTETFNELYPAFTRFIQSL